MRGVVDISVLYYDVFVLHLRYRPSAGLFPIIVSQDCGHQPTADAIASYGARVTHIKVRLQHFMPAIA